MTKYLIKRHAAASYSSSLEPPSRRNENDEEAEDRENPYAKNRLLCKSFDFLIMLELMAK